LLGRRLTLEEKRLVDDVAVSICVADPRIWPMKVTRLAGAYGGLVPAYVAGQLCVQGAMLGLWPFRGAAALLVRLQSTFAARGEEETTLRDAFAREIASTRHPAGFGVPFRAVDERVTFLQHRVVKSSRASLPFFRLYLALADLARSEHKLEANISLAAGAALMDVGFSASQTVPVILAVAAAMYVAHAAEAEAHPEPLLQRMPDEWIRYVGKPPRDSADR
jgi:hypothetical protein